MKKLYEDILDELRLAGIEEPDAIIRTMMTSFAVSEVTQDVVDAIREDYLTKV